MSRRRALLLRGLAACAGRAEIVAVNDTRTPIVLEDPHGRWVEWVLRRAR